MFVKNRNHTLAGFLTLLDEQRNISIKKKKHLCNFLGIKEQAAQYGFGTYELNLAKSGGKTENYAIITQGQVMGS